MAVKLTMILAATTVVKNASVASAHSGGWSESFWYAGTTPSTQNFLQQLASLRARLLPKQASIIGFRSEIYTLAQNKLLPGGTSGFKIQQPGNPNYTLNLPQDSLELTGQATGATNTNRFRLGALPDECVTTGEYDPDGPFNDNVGIYTLFLSSPAAQFGFPGRVLTNPSVRVVSITPGPGGTATVVTSAPIGAVAGTSYVRFHRTYDQLDNPVKGTYLVMTAPAPNTYGIVGFTGQTVANPSGTARLDQLQIYQYASIGLGRAVVKKIGRPSSSYRGRQSNRTPA